MATILNFRILVKNGKKTNLLLSPKPCEVERFWRNFRPTGYLSNILLAIFKKISHPQKWRPICIFEFLSKMEKHKFASMFLTVRDTAISSKFSIHRVSEKCTLGNFQKIFLFPHMVAILNFHILVKNGKIEICFYLLNRAR